MNSLPPIPNDLAACQALLARQQQQLAQLQKEKMELQLAFNELLRRAFVKKSERYLEDPRQLQLDFGNTPEAADAAEGLAEAVTESAAEEVVVAEHTRRKQKASRNEQLPEHLERYEVEAAVPEEMKTCSTHGAGTIIGYDYQETLEFERPKLRVRRLKIPKFACPGSPVCGVARPERPEGLVEGNRYDTSVAAEIITAKFGYHLPIYRQQDYFASSDQPSVGARRQAAARS